MRIEVTSEAGSYMFVWRMHVKLEDTSEAEATSEAGGFYVI